MFITVLYNRNKEA